MRSFLLATGLAALGFSDLAWIDLRLAPSILDRSNVQRARAADVRPTMRVEVARVVEDAHLAVVRNVPPATTNVPPLPAKIVLLFDVDAREPLAAVRRDEEAAL